MASDGRRVSSRPRFQRRHFRAWLFGNIKLSFLAFPVGQIDDAAASEIQRGGREVLARADCPLVGGHTLDDRELKYGFAVLGTARKRDLLPNSAARPGDLLILTKPLGNGVIIKALKDGVWDEDKFARCRSWMAQASNVVLQIDVARLPILGGAMDLIRKGVIPRGAKNNRTYLESRIRWLDDIREDLKWALFDPQTSGGLLISVPPECEDQLRRLCKKNGVPAVIGRVLPADPSGPRLILSP